MNAVNFDGLVKSRKCPLSVIPANRRRAEAALCRVAKAEAGIQFFQLVTEILDSGFLQSDDFLPDCQY